jgi:iron complex outermembrane receptor protein
MRTSAHSLRVRYLVSASGLTLALIVGASPAAVAQEDVAAIEDRRLGTVTITAEKREADIQSVPLSVTAFDGEALDRLGVEDSTDLAAYTPGLNIGTPVGEGNNPSITLRGVGLNDFNDNNEGPVAVYVDEVYIAALAGLTFQLFDTQRVEVLRGPQGTLYGRNATGGLVHFISNKPTATFEAEGKLAFGSYGEVSAESAISGPLADGVRGRLAAKVTRADPYVDNRGPGADANESDSVAIRTLVELDIGDKGSLLLKGNYADSGVAPSPKYQHQGTGSPFGETTDIWGYSDTDEDPFAGAYDTNGTLEIENAGLSADLQLSLGKINLRSITAYGQVQKRHVEDTDVGPFRGIVPTFQADVDQFSQELRLSGDWETGNWILGAYYLDTRVEGDNTLEVNWRGDFANILDSDPSVFDGGLTAFSGPIPDTAALIPAILYDVDYTQSTESLSAFGQVNWRINDSVELTGGLRYTDEERDIQYVNAAPAGPLLNNLIIGIGAPNYFDFRDGADGVGDLNKINPSNVSGKLGIEFEPNSALLVYGNLSQGFKSGGFNAGFLDFTDGLTPTDAPYDEEVLTAYEAGFKWDFADGRARLNASTFYYDYQDYQALTFQGLSQYITNAEAESRGAEIEFFALPTSNISLQIGASYLDAQVDGVRNLNAVDPADQILDGLRPVLAPEFTANGVAAYTWNILGGELVGSLNFSHQGEHFFDITNSPISRSDSYTTYGARISYTSPDEAYELAAFVKNLTDEEYLVYTFDFTGPAGLNQQFYGQPRWFGASIGVRF